MKCTSKIKINQRKINQLSKAAVVSLEQTTEALHAEVVQAQVMPRDTGAMQGENTFSDYKNSRKGRNSIVTSSPQARRLYYHPEYHFSKAENPNAKGKWYEDWLSGGKKGNFAPKVYKEFYRRNAGL